MRTHVNFKSAGARVVLPTAFEGISFGGKDVQAHLQGFRTVLEEVLSAMEDKDLVLAMDLLQYEVIPLIEDVSQAIPAVREAVQQLAEQPEDVTE